MARPVTVFLIVTLTAVQGSAAQCMSDNDALMKISEKGRQELLQSQLQFSADLLQTVGHLYNAENVFFSPSSIYNAFLLAYFVSANQTEASLKKTLQLPVNQNKLDTLGSYSLEKYYQKLRSIKGSLNYQLSNANRMFISNKQKIVPCMKKHFYDEIETADFSNQSATVTRINKWVSDQTRSKINDLLPSDSINNNTNLVLVNAAYFRGLWKHQFSPSETRAAEFKLANGTTTSVMMMTVESKFSYRTHEKLGAEVIELPYEGEDISMFILLPLKPSETATTDLLNEMNADALRDIVNSSPPPVGEISVVIPKFSVDQSLDLTSVMETIGVGDLFQSSADLSTLTGTSGLNLDSAVHKAKITVDETGTEAAAATAIFANRFAADSFIANHPFVYILFDKKSHILLFAGVLNSPQS